MSRRRILERPEQQHFAWHVVRWLQHGLAALLFLAGGYGLAGVGGSILPANGDWQEGANGIQLFIHDNGIHTGLVLPRRNAIADWSDLVRPQDLARPVYASNHLLFGWGDREFYLATPRWADLRPATAVTALIGSDSSLIHVDHIASPVPASTMRAITVSPEEYAHIAGAIRTQFRLDEDGQSQPVAGYGSADVFYEAIGRYSPYRTCNEWTGSLLRNAGIRTGLWTPFNFGVMRWH
jgi:uncharacterized protein (TIGR02117 family)